VAPLLARGLCAAAALAVAVGLTTRADARPDDTPKTGFIKKTFKNADGTESPYVVFVPEKYDATKAYPVILFLHGAGETKGGTKQPVEVGIGTAIKTREKTFPFITVIPQSEKRTWKADSDDGKRAMAILDAVMKDYKIDPERQYLTGLSMGGYGTWSHAVAYPDRWAAIVPVCGGGDPKSAEKIKHIPCWCFHGDEDGAVPVQRSREMIEALKGAGGDPRYTEYKWVGHDSWDPAYATNELYVWLLKQSKKK
jgi:predicted peptidase